MPEIERLLNVIEQLLNSEEPNPNHWVEGKQDAEYGLRPQRLSRAYLDGYFSFVENLPTTKPGYLDWSGTGPHSRFAHGYVDGDEF
ncbi:hypothetical protein IQ268_16930 [Oculatella sp. LEGE 06141]|uniref:hypothetical protein n=1 Tax=Oculatella sp. LEGE 06141 TaxID=1828648 RepID=UPI00187EF101|nr:hypothetical protein [Oculatella sp. LEGE 06141]MBE9180250.1 hypothetical protein [Oculatella sp. LEGE 06141]